MSGQQVGKALAAIALTLFSFPIDPDVQLPVTAADCYQLSVDARGEAGFTVSVLTCDGDLTTAPDIIRGALTASSGAYFPSPSFVIRKGESSAESMATLNAASGWVGVITAKAVQLPGMRILECTLSHRVNCSANGMEIRASSHWAQANGRQAIIIEVRFYREDHGRRIYLKPEDENADEWVVHLTASKNGVRFGESGWPELVIRRGQYSGWIKLYSDIPISNLRVSADAINMNGTRLTATLDGLSFGLPWPQLLLSSLAGAVFPLLRRQQTAAKRKQQIALGVAFAIAVYLMLFFGAVVVGQVEIGGFLVDLRHLPLGSWPAACLIGFLASLPVQSAFICTVFRDAMPKNKHTGYCKALVVRKIVALLRCFPKSTKKSL